MMDTTRLIHLCLLTATVAVVQIPFVSQLFPRQFMSILQEYSPHVQQIFSNASQSFATNTSSLLQQLNTTTPTYTAVSAPRCLVMDNHGYLETMSYSLKSTVRLHAENMTEITVPVSPIFTDFPWSLAYYGGAYYVGFTDPILILDSTNMSVLQSITGALVVQLRDMTFLNGGKQMIAVSSDYFLLLFFNRSSSTSYDYSFIGSQSVNCTYPSCLFNVNETLFSLSSWGDNQVFNYSNLAKATSWIETLATGSRWDPMVF
jgi:hypothetical protein